MDPKQTEELAARWTAAQRTVAAYINTLIPDFHQSEEVLQHVAVALVRKYTDYDSKRPFVAWVIGIAKNEVLAFRRKRALDKHLFDDALIDQLTSRYQKLAGDFSSVHEALVHCMKKIDGRGREAIELRYTEGLKPNRIAMKLDISPTAARSLLNRIRNTLRECIQNRLKINFSN